MVIARFGTAHARVGPAADHGGSDNGLPFQYPFPEKSRGGGSVLRSPL